MAACRALTPGSALEEPEKPSRAVEMEPMVTAMFSQDRKVRSLAKKVCSEERCQGRRCGAKEAE